jgi:hypothetical protein
MYVAIVIAAVFACFVFWRVRQAPLPVSPGRFAPISAQAPLPADLAFAPDDPPQR